jgi:hypothetical protein
MRAWHFLSNEGSKIGKPLVKRHWTLIAAANIGSTVSTDGGGHDFETGEYRFKTSRPRAVVSID